MILFAKMFKHVFFCCAKNIQVVLHLFLQRFRYLSTGVECAQAPTEKVALQLEAVKTFVDVFGKERRPGPLPNLQQGFYISNEIEVIRI